MNHDEPLERPQAEIARPLLPCYATPSLTAFPDDIPPPPAEPLLLPPANPAHHREPRYDEQDIDGYTIAEAHAALEAFKRRRKNQP